MPRHVLQNRFLRSSIAMLGLGVLAGAAFSSLAQATVPHPKRKEEYKQQVEKLEETWRLAQLNDDVVGMDKLLSDDYVGITMSGQLVTKAQQLDRMKNRDLVLTKIVMDEVRVRLIGTTAIVNALADIDGTSEGSSMHGTYRYTRVYSRLPSGTWKITNFEATRVGPPQPPPPDGRHPRNRQQSPPQQQ